MTTQPRTVILIAAISVAVVATGIGVSVGRGSHDSTSPAATPQSTATPGTTPSGASAEVLHEALRQALAQRTVHSTAREVTSDGTTTFDNYDGVNAGKQTIAINGGSLEVRVIGNTTYLNGDAKGLAVYGIKAKLLNGKWLKLVAGESGYADITAGVTLASALQADQISGPLRSLATKTIDGEEVTGISGRGTGANSPAGAHATMWISRSTGLPVEFDAVTSGTTIIVTFADWGVPIHVATPTDVYGEHTLSG